MDTHWYFWENAVERHGVTLKEVEEALDNIVEEQIQPEGRSGLGMGRGSKEVLSRSPSSRWSAFQRFSR